MTNEQLAERSAGLKAWLVETYGAIDGAKMCVTDAGSRYISFCSGGIKEEGGAIPALSSTVAGVVADWKKHVQKYAAEHDGKMLIRTWPEIKQHQCLAGDDAGATYVPVTMYAVRSRLVIE